MKDWYIIKLQLVSKKYTYWYSHIKESVKKWSVYNQLHLFWLKPSVMQHNILLLKTVQFNTFLPVLPNFPSANIFNQARMFVSKRKNQILSFLLIVLPTKNLPNIHQDYSFKLFVDIYNSVQQIRKWNQTIPTIP